MPRLDNDGLLPGGVKKDAIMRSSFPYADSQINQTY